MGALVFVVMELSPFTRGGIGRALHNIIKTMSGRDQSRCHVIAMDCDFNAAAFEAVFPGSFLHMVDSRAEVQYDEIAIRPAQASYGSSFHWKSAMVLAALRKLSLSTNIEYVEFQDWGSHGFSTIQEQRITKFLGDATLAVRLHSTHAAIVQAEAYKVGDDDRYLIDLERKALRDCDLIIGQSAPAAEHMRKMFGFSTDEWDSRLVIHSPPVLLDKLEARGESVPANCSMPIMFGSKIQGVKRPDLFIRGVSTFMRERSEFVGPALISAHVANEQYGKAIRGMIQEDVASRFKSNLPTDSISREPLIAGSTFVVPSDFESFCLVAYEASKLGARVILNAANPAFGEGSPWIDGVNCFKFDGTARGLANALHRNFDNAGPLSVVEVEEHPWPWNVSPKARFESDVKARRPKVSVIVPHFNLGQFLPATLQSVLEQTYDNIEIILVDDHSTDEASCALINALERGSNASLKIIKLPGNVGLSAARNAAIAQATGEYVLPLDADDVIHGRFIEVGVQALERNTEFDVFVSPAAYFSEDDQLLRSADGRDHADYAVFIGEALISGFRANKFSTASAIMRTSVLRQYPYREELRCYEDWNLYLRLAQDGKRFLVSNEVYFFYRNRPGSMVKDSWDPGRHAQFLHDNLRTSTQLSKLVPLAYLAFLDNVSEARVAASPAALQRSDGVNALVSAALARQMQTKPSSSKFGWISKMFGQRQSDVVFQVVSQSELFDEDWYLRTNNDVAIAGLSAVGHYVAHGAKEGRDPGPFFSSSGYLAANPDVAAADMNPLYHFIVYGFKEGRRLQP